MDLMEPVPKAHENHLKVSLPSPGVQYYAVAEQRSACSFPTASAQPAVPIVSSIASRW